MLVELLKVAGAVALLVLILVFSISRSYEARRVAVLEERLEQVAQEEAQLATEFPRDHRAIEAAQQTRVCLEHALMYARGERT